MQITNNRAAMLLNMACDTNEAVNFMVTLRDDILDAENIDEIMPGFVAEAALVLFTTIDMDEIIPAGRRFAQVLEMLDHWMAMPMEVWQRTFQEYAQLSTRLVRASARKGINVSDNAEDALICLNSMMDTIEGKLRKQS